MDTQVICHQMWSQKMGKFSKRKGYRVENQIVNQIKAYGIQARRQPMSGAIPDFPYDIEIRKEPFHKLSVEVKARANGEGFKTLERWKDNADLLCLHRDRADTLVCLNLELFLDILSITDDTVYEQQESTRRRKRKSTKRS